MPSIIRLIVKDFCCIKELDLNLKDIGLVQIVGQNRDSDAAISNGSGKTTIFKAITWCLYCDTLDKDKYDEVIRYGAKSACVELHIADGKNLWKVKREKGTIIMEKDGENLVFFIENATGERSLKRKIKKLKG